MVCRVIFASRTGVWSYPLQAMEASVFQVMSVRVKQGIHKSQPWPGVVTNSHWQAQPMSWLYEQSFAGCGPTTPYSYQSRRCRRRTDSRVPHGLISESLQKPEHRGRDGIDGSRWIGADFEESPGIQAVFW